MRNCIGTVCHCSTQDPGGPFAPRTRLTNTVYCSNAPKRMVGLIVTRFPAQDFTVGVLAFPAPQISSLAKGIGKRTSLYSPACLPSVELCGSHNCIILVQALYKHGRCPSVRQTLYKHGRCPSRLNDSFRCQMFRVEPVQVLLAERAVVISCPSVSSGVQEVDPRSRGPATPWQHDTHSRTRHLAGPTRNLRLAWHRETTAEILPPGCC